MQMELTLRFDYSTVVPWVSRLEDNRLCAIAGPDRIVFASTVELRGEDLKTRADFEIEEGQTVSFALTWSHSFGSLPSPIDAVATVDYVTNDWKKWSDKLTFQGPYAEATLRSIITLKALTHHETGGIVAAATTSLPEQIGGIRNWDYRFCWIRDAAYTLYALIRSGFIDEAKEWRDWLLRAVAGKPERVQIMYGIAGERRLSEFELAELPGYEGSRPVRIGNAASEQLQLDIYGEVLDAGYLARRKGLQKSEAGWELARALVNHLETIWTQPDEGIWEIRGPRRHFVHSKVMAWVAFDRAVRIIQEFGADGPLDRWVRLRGDIHDEVCRLGFSRELNSFVQYYGSKELDASLLLLPLVGFLPAEDSRVRGTVAAIEKHLMQDRLVARYNTRSTVDGRLETKVPFSPVAFGWLITISCKAGSTRHAPSSSTCFRCATMSDFWRKNTMPKNTANWETFHRLSLISRSSTVPTTSAQLSTPDRTTTVAKLKRNGEEYKRRSNALSLSGNQDQLVATIVAANPRTVVVIRSGSAILMPWVDSPKWTSSPMRLILDKTRALKSDMP
jgi:GH15 family glucan-1,4-alpha-glucosidase